MIPFKYYIQIYKRYITVYLQNKKQNIKEWFNKSKEDKYKYFNPDKSKERLDSSGSNITEAIFGNEIRGGSIDMRDKIYCEDINRSLHFNKCKLKIINNTLQSIFNKPFKTFSLRKDINKNLEELSLEINNSANKYLLYSLLLVPIVFIIIMLFSGESVITYDWAKETSNTVVNPPSPDNKNFDVILFWSIVVIIGIYLAITLILSILFNIVMFICLWKFVNKNAKLNIFF